MCSGLRPLFWWPTFDRTVRRDIVSVTTLNFFFQEELSINMKCRRDTFSDRVCDDLSEFILQYLSFEDKFRLEGVSKQFQRTVFVRQTEVPFYIFPDSGDKLVAQRKYFEVLMQKLPNFNCISLDISESIAYQWASL